MATPVGDRCYFSSTNRLLQGSCKDLYIYHVCILLYICVYLYVLCNYIFSTYIQIHQNKMFLSLTWQTFFNHLKFDPRRFESSRPRGLMKNCTKQRKEMKSFPTTGCRSEARLEPKQKRNTGVRPKHLII